MNNLYLMNLNVMNSENEIKVLFTRRESNITRLKTTTMGNPSIRDFENYYTYSFPRQK